jgi:DNA-3-methyladenine glycosylase
LTLAELAAGDVLDVAPALLGWTLLHEGVGGRIVEVEAYREDDPASHSYRGETPRTRPMFGPPGHLYVYRSYGIHWCANITCGPPGYGAAVLLRALEPTHGVEVMRERRGGVADMLLCSGPGRLGQALGLDARHSGASLAKAPFSVVPPARPVLYDVAPRVGISRATQQPWRFVQRSSPWASRGRPRA